MPKKSWNCHVKLLKISEKYNFMVEAHLIVIWNEHSVNIYSLLFSFFAFYIWVFLMLTLINIAISYSECKLFYHSYVWCVNHSNYALHYTERNLYCAIRMQFISSFWNLIRYNFNIVWCLFSMASLINFKLQLFRKWPFYSFLCLPVI